MLKDYLKIVRARAQKSHVYTKHQLIGLEIARLVEDEAHKSLYMKLAKEHSSQRLMELAKSVAEKKDIEQKGAYFMKILHEEGFLSSQEQEL